MTSIDVVSVNVLKYFHYMKYHIIPDFTDTKQGDEANIKKTAIDCVTEAFKINIEHNTRFRLTCFAPKHLNFQHTTDHISTRQF